MTFAPVLYVEDDPNDVLFMQLGFARANLPYPLQISRNGKLAIDYLAGNGQYADRSSYPVPCLMLLDLNLPIAPDLRCYSGCVGNPNSKPCRS